MLSIKSFFGAGGPCKSGPLSFLGENLKFVQSFLRPARRRSAFWRKCRESSLPVRFHRLASCVFFEHCIARSTIRARILSLL